MSILLPQKLLPSLPDPFWLPGPEHPGLPGDELHIWRAFIPNPDSLDDSDPFDGCPVDRQLTDKINLALFQNDILERYALADDIAAIPAARLRVAIAQCDHVALIAVSRNVRRMGLDVERVREDIPIEDLAGGFLDPRSQWDLRVTWSQQEKAWKFFQFWTSNEACEQARPSSRTKLSCEVRGFTPEADFIAALAVDGGPEVGIIFWDWICQGL
jgi:hypothetical protein